MLQKRDPKYNVKHKKRANNLISSVQYYIFHIVNDSNWRKKKSWHSLEPNPQKMAGRNNLHEIEIDNKYYN